MKNFGRLTLIIGLILFCSSTTYAQKFGHINSQELITSMPDMDSVNAKMVKLQKDFSDQLEIIQVEFNTKFQEYQKNSTTYTPAVAQLKESELNALRTRFQEFQEVADKDMQEMQSKLMTPIVTRAQNAIKKVGKDNGFTVIYDLAVGSLVYYDEATVINVLSLVQKELGFTPKAPATTPAPAK